MAGNLGLPIDLVLVRHGESEANAVEKMTLAGDVTGREALLATRRHDSEVRLTDLGREQARAVGAWVREHLGAFDRYFVSQYTRTKETAACMALPNALWTADVMLRERDQGLQEGQGSARLGLSAEEQERRARSAMYWAPVAGESVADLCTRIRHFLNDLSQTSSGMRVVVVCHHQVIKAFRLRLEDRPQEEYTEVLDEPMPNCAIWWYTRRDANGIVHSRVQSGKRIVVGLDGQVGVTSFPVRRHVFTNEQLMEQVHKIPQLINNGSVVTRPSRL